MNVGVEGRAAEVQLCAACKSKINMLAESGWWRHSGHYVAGFPLKLTVVRSVSLPH